ncbi:MAG: glycosyl hydrolase [Bryobacteraceae bacterium]
MTWNKAALLLIPMALLVAQTPKKLTIADFSMDRESERKLLLRPKAIPQTPAASTEQLKKAFADPASEYRSMPLWVWNDQMEWPRLKEQLAQFKQQGMGGVFIHPRPGLMTEYLGTDWFKLWKMSMEEGKRLGMIVNIYDENSYPSGFAGGNVPSLLPDTASQFVQAELDVPAGAIHQRRGVSVSLFVVKKDASGLVTEARRVGENTAVREGESVLAFRLRRASGNPWTGEFPYVDLTNPQTTPAFLESTYEVYKKNVGSEFGKTVKWAFTDEPLLATGGAYDSARLALPLSYNTLAEFQKRNGYDLAGELPSLYWDIGDFRKVRFDYWQTLHDLWKENYMRPMFLWCDRNNIQFTGHFMEHEWPAPFITPGDGSLYAYEHVPGIDLLEGSKLRTDGKDAHLLFTIKQVSSVSHQMGRRAFCEAYGVAGWDGTLEHYKRFGDWLMVHGINFMDQHLAFSTIRGARKRDHPQSFTDHSAWWPYYKESGDHLGRVSFLSSIGESRNRVLLMTPTTSGFLWARRDGSTPELETMRTDNADLNQFMADHQVDFDLGDEYMVEWFGKEEGRKLTIGKASYDLVVWPKNMTNVRKETVPHLERYLANGGVVLALGPAAQYVDGRESDAVQKMAQRYASQWISAPSHDVLLSRIEERLPRRVTFDHELPTGAGLMERWLPDRSRMLFLANTSLQGVTTTMSVAGGSIEEWDTINGTIKPARFTSSNGKLGLTVDLPPAGSALYIVRDAAAPPAPPKAESRYVAAAVGPWQAKADTPNVLVLDYCDIKAGKLEQKDVNTWQANWSTWQQHGFERPAWDNAVQFKTRIFDKNHFAADSGFEANFHFAVRDKAALSGMQLALEMPELYRVAVNGSPVDFKNSERWLDHHIRTVSIEKLAHEGENTVSITAAPFDVRMELENIYIRGNFSVRPEGKGFAVAAPAALGFGSWAKQGLPFYADAVRYETEVTAPAGASMLRVELPEWQGSVVEVILDGKRQSQLAWQPFAAEMPVTAGKHTVSLRVVSTPRNIFGPYHNPTKPRMRAWPAAWAEFPEHQPGGGKYDILDYGLMQPPAVSVTMTGTL